MQYTKEDIQPKVQFILANWYRRGHKDRLLSRWKDFLQFFSTREQILLRRKYPLWVNYEKTNTFPDVVDLTDAEHAIILKAVQFFQKLIDDGVEIPVEFIHNKEEAE